MFQRYAGDHLPDRFEFQFFDLFVEVQVGEDGVVPYGQDGDDGFHCGGGAQGVPGERFRGGDGRDGVPEDPPDGDSFRQVVVVGAGTVSVDIADVPQIEAGNIFRSGLQRVAHRQERSVAVGRRSGLVVGVVGVGVSGEFTERRPAAQRLFRFQHKESGSFAEVQAGAAFVERPAMVFVEDHQGVEAVEGELRQRIAPAGQHPVEEAVVDQPGPEHDRVGGGGAGGADGAHHIAKSQPGRDLLGAVAAVVGEDEVVVRFAFFVMPVVDLRLVHAADSAGRDHAGAETVVFRVDARILQRLGSRYHAQQGGAGVHIDVGNAGKSGQFCIGQLDFAGRQFVAVDRIENGDLSDAVTAGLQRGQRFAGIFTDGTDDPDARNKNPARHGLFFLVLEDVIGHRTDRSKDLPTLFRIFDLDAVIFFK